MHIYCRIGKGLKQLMLLRESPTSDISDDLYESGKIEKYGIKNFIKEFESVLFATKGLELVVISGVIVSIFFRNYVHAY